MRKLLLLFVMVSFVFALNAQSSQRPLAPAALDYNQVYEIPAATNIPFNKAFGDPIWGEDFGGGALPTGWTVADGNQMNFNWYWSNDPRPGITGTYSTNNDTFRATTADNGYMMISGDIYNAGGGAVTMDAEVKTQMLNLDTTSSVMIEWQQYFRYCCNANDAQLWFGISTDGVNWMNFDARQNVAVNIPSANPATVQINLTPYLAGQDSVWLRWYKGGASHYFWAIDDIKMYAAPLYELELMETYISKVTSDGSLTGYYSKMPLSQIMPVYFGADLINNGDLDQTNVNFNARVYDSGDNLIYDEVADTTGLTLVFDSIAELEVTNYFETTTSDTYRVEFEAISDATDEIPENNFGGEASWEVTDNTIFARDISWTGYYYPGQYVGGGDGDFAGTNYVLANQSSVQSISVYVDYRSTEGGVMFPQVYFDDGTDVIVKISGDEHTVAKKDLGTWVTMPLIPIAQDDEVLTPNTLYIAGIEFYYETVGADLFLGRDNNPTHLFNLATTISLDGSWYYASLVPMVRLNMTDAVLPPQFTSARLDTAPKNLVYTYTATATDPQGLPLSFMVDDFSDGALVSYVDNGDGSVTLTLADTPENLGYEIGDRFRVRIFADNGTTINEQYFYITVVDDFFISVDETPLADVQVYPNPARDILFVNHAPQAQIYVYNILGEVVRNIQRADASERISVADLAPGTYIVRIQTDNDAVIKKVNITR